MSQRPRGETLEANSIPLNGSPEAEGDLDYQIHVLCSFHFENCPTIEIVDKSSGSVRVIKPDSTEKTLIGKRMYLGVRQKPGTGTGYTLANPRWTLEGRDDDKVIKSYDLMAAEPEVDGLGTNDLNDPEVTYYYVVKENGYTVKVTAELEKNSGTSKDSVTVTFDVNGPTVDSMKGPTIVGGMSVGPALHDTSITILSLGQAVPPEDTANQGIRYQFYATPPPGDTGYVVGTQLANGEAGAYPSEPEVWETNGYDLDGCPLYDEYTQALNSKYVWASYDSPRISAEPTDTLLELDTQFRMYFMYRPRGAHSIWVPIGELEWFVDGEARRVGSSWVMEEEDASENPTGGPSSDFPEWDAVLLPPQSCPQPPAN